MCKDSSRFCNTSSELKYFLFRGVPVEPLVEDGEGVQLQGEGGEIWREFAS